jgi:hypothetical protein
LSTVSGLVPADSNGGRIVDSTEFSAVLPHLDCTGIVSQAELNMVRSHYFWKPMAGLL